MGLHRPVIITPSGLKLPETGTQNPRNTDLAAASDKVSIIRSNGLQSDLKRLNLFQENCAFHAFADARLLPV
jgi:hypothetical protein